MPLSSHRSRGASPDVPAKELVSWGCGAEKRGKDEGARRRISCVTTVAEIEASPRSHVSGKKFPLQFQ